MSLTVSISIAFLLQATPSAKGPQLAPQPVLRRPTDEVVINEIMYNPPNGAFLEEFVEVHNTSSRDVVIGGASFTDGMSYTFPDGYVLPAHGFAVVAADVPTFQAKYPAVTGVLGPWVGKLRNSGETITLTDDRGNELDSVRYADQGTWADRREGPVSFNHTGWEWVVDHDGGGSSAELINHVLSNKRGHNWGASLAVGGSPGAANSVTSSNGAPLLSNLSHSPAVPTSNESVAITVRVEDEDPENLDLELFYRDISSGGAFSSISMGDSGTNGDETADDSEFTALIPPGAPNQGFEFYVRAEDGDAQVRTLPGPTDAMGNQEANAIYQIDDAVAAMLPLEHDAKPIVRLIFTDAENAELHSLQDTPDEKSKALFNATLITLYPGDTDVRYLCGVRPRGNGSLDQMPPQYRVNIRHDDPWGGRVEVNFNNQYPHSQVFGSVAYRWAGIPAAVAYPLLLQVNNVDMTNAGEPNMGHYNYLQQMDSDFAAQQYPLTPDLNIYRGDRGEAGDKADLRWEGTDPEEYKDAYFKRTNAELDDYSDLIALCDELNNAPGATYFADVNAVADLEQWALFFAWDRLVGNREGSIGNGAGDDYHLSFHPVTNRAQLFPHDLDTLMGQGDQNPNPTETIYAAGNAEGLSRLFTNSEFLALYIDTILSLLDTHFNHEKLDPIIDETVTGVANEGQVLVMKGFIDARRDSVLNQIDSEPNVTNPGLPIQDGFATTTDSQYLLSGTANSHEVYRVLINGMPANFYARDGSWVTGQFTPDWEVAIPFGDTWSYLDDGSDQGTEWTALEFNDESWATGPAPLGYGILGAGTEVEFGGNAADKHPTTYFRHHFEIDHPLNVFALEVDANFDDGIAISINGTEVAREHLVPEFTDASEFAEVAVEGALEDRPIRFRIPTHMLVSGENVITAEVHQIAADDADLRFDLELRLLRTARPRLALIPGINQLTVEYVDSDGAIVASEELDIFYDNGLNTPLSGAIAGPFTMDNAGSPYHITADTTITGGLIIEPGTTVFFADGATLTVDGDPIIARGHRSSRIWLGPIPGSATETPRIVANAGLYMDFADYHGSTSVLDSTGFHAATTLVAHDNYFAGRGEDLLTLDAASVLFRANEVEAMFGTPPMGAADGKEYLHAINGIGDYFRVESNRFGTTAGDSDIVRIEGVVLADPAAEVRGNTFLGGESAILHTAGHALFEDNVVVGLSDSDAGALEDSSVIQAAGTGQVFSITRNLIVDSQHAAELIDGAFAYLENNTVSNIVADPNTEDSPVMLANSTALPGTGAFLAGNLWDGIPSTVLGRPDDGTTSLIEAHDDLVPSAAAYANVSGTHNVDFLEGTATFVDPGSLDYSLQPGSAGEGVGPFGLDVGASVPQRITITGVPDGISNMTTANLTVGGPGMFGYIFRLDDGPWSSPQIIHNWVNTAGENKPRTATLALNGLTPGLHSVSVRGLDLSARAQPSITLSNSWVVLPGPVVRLSEVLANNQGVHDVGGFFPDYVELTNNGPSAIGLNGFSISDDINVPDKFVFGAGANIQSDSVAVINLQNVIPFSLDKDGDEFFLFSPAGFIVDSVRFGAQPPNMSLSRSFGDPTWRLAPPSPGVVNAPPSELSDPSELIISEWLANSGDFTDFIEIHNPTANPIRLEGLHLTNAYQIPDLYTIDPLSFIGAGESYAYIADGVLPAEQNHMPFTLEKDFGSIGLFDTQLNPIDFVSYGPQATDVSQGRLLDGTPGFFFFALPSPGAANSLLPGLGELTINELVASNSTTLMDEDGDFSDWVELKNTSGGPIDLGGWFLTDNGSNLTKWAFPSQVIADGEYLIVFCSSKDRAVAGNELHTNFKLGASGEYLGIVKPDGTTVGFQYAPTFPALVADQAYGLPNDVDAPGYLATPTPGALNSPESLALVGFSNASGVFSSPFGLVLSADLSGGGDIRFTTDGTEPGLASPIYSGAYTVDQSVRVRARIVDGTSLGPITQASYTELEPSVASFSSTLPLVIVDTFGASISTAETALTGATITVIDRLQGTAVSTDAPDYSGFGGIRVRGASSENFPKKQYKFELWDDTGEDLNANLLNFGAESDWVLYAPGRFDRAMINNPLIFSLANQAGMTTMDSQFCEVYVNDGGGPVSDADYDGIYLLTESIKIDSNRIDIEKMSPAATAVPAITGGYVLSIDTQDDSLFKFKTSSGIPSLGNIWINVVKPNQSDLNPFQEAWITNHIEEFEAALFGPDFADPVLGYRAYIDPGAWIDHSLLRVLAKDIDIYRKSDYFYKDVGGLITNAPVWDFDRTLESDDPRDDDPREIYNCCGHSVDPFGWDWWGRLFEDPAFRAEYQARWYAIRAAHLSNTAVFASIDALHAEISEAYPREEARWGATSGYGSRFGDLQGEIDHMKDWLVDRLDFLDSFFETFEQADLAEGLTPTQSSTTNSGDAARAVDGELGGIFSNGSVTHTASELQPWWELDLGASQSIGTIRVWNRTDCCVDRLSDFHVLVSDDPFTSTDLATTQGQVGVMDLAFPGIADVFEDFLVGTTGRYIRIQLEGTDPLSLAEVEVFESRNVALGAPTQQSSRQELAAAGVDGNLRTDPSERNVAETEYEDQPWWEVDLGAVYELDAVRLWRPEGLPQDGLHILVSRTPFKPGSDLAYLQGTPGVTDVPLDSPAAVLEHVSTPAEGRYVRIQMEGPGRLALGEVQVLSRGLAPARSAARATR